MIIRNQRLLLVGLVWVVGALFLGQGLYMVSKARVAQALIAMSWLDSPNQFADDRPPPKPWWWADTRAIAKMRVERLNKSVYIMQDDSGESLAFGPGHVPGSAKPAKLGHVIIAGHRDSHFSFLQNIEINDVIKTENYLGETKHYQVTKLHVIDSSQRDLHLLDNDHLTLVTCYPFNDFIPGGPLRFLVEAEPII